MLRELDLTDNYLVYSNFASDPPLMGFDMSFQAMAWALKQPAKTNEKFLLIVIANYADERGHAWPSVERLSVDTGMARATIQRALRKLEKSGFISCHKRVRGQLQTSNLYVLRGRFA